MNFSDLLNSFKKAPKLEGNIPLRPVDSNPPPSYPQIDNVLLQKIGTSKMQSPTQGNPQEQVMAYLNEYFDQKIPKYSSDVKEWAKSPDIQAKIAQKKEAKVQEQLKQEQLNEQAYRYAIDNGFKNWGENLPASKYSDNYLANLKKYPIYQKNPFMFPSMTLLETAGGEKLAKANNPLNWGIYQDEFQPQSFEEVFDKAASGIAERFPIYQEFRDSGNLYDMAKYYAPDSDNPGTGGQNYVNNLESVMNVFKKQYEDYLKNNLESF